MIMPRRALHLAELSQIGMCISPSGCEIVTRRCEMAVLILPMVQCGHLGVEWGTIGSLTFWLI